MRRKPDVPKPIFLARVIGGGVDNQIHKKSTRGADLSEARKAHNRQKSKIRCLVELVFGCIENSMSGPALEYIGMARITTGIGLANLTYNLCRYVQLIRLGRVAVTP